MCVCVYVSVCIYIYIFFFFGRAAYGILIPRPGMEPVPPAIEAQSLNHWTTREVPTNILNCSIYDRKVFEIYLLLDEWNWP